jgi:hypothetical protein
VSEESNPEQKLHTRASQPWCDPISIWGRVALCCCTDVFCRMFCDISGLNPLGSSTLPNPNDKPKCFQAFPVFSGKTCPSRGLATKGNLGSLLSGSSVFYPTPQRPPSSALSVPRTTSFQLLWKLGFSLPLLSPLLASFMRSLNQQPVRRAQGAHQTNSSPNNA